MIDKLKTACPLEEYKLGLPQKTPWFSSVHTIKNRACQWPVLGDLLISLSLCNVVVKEHKQQSEGDAVWLQGHGHTVKRRNDRDDTLLIRGMLLAR